MTKEELQTQEKSHLELIEKWEEATDFIGAQYVRLLDKKRQLMSGQFYIGDDAFDKIKQHAIKFHLNEIKRLNVEYKAEKNDENTSPA